MDQPNLFVNIVLCGRILIIAFTKYSNGLVSRLVDILYCHTQQTLPKPWDPLDEREFTQLTNP